MGFGNDGQPNETSQRIPVHGLHKETPKHRSENHAKFQLLTVVFGVENDENARFGQFSRVFGPVHGGMRRQMATELGLTAFWLDS